MPETARCSLQHDVIWGQMKYRLHEWKCDTTLSERRVLSTFWVVLISLTGSLAVSWVVWILLTEHVQWRCTFDPIVAVDIARVVTHTALCIVVSCLREKPSGTVSRGWDYCHALFCPVFHSPFPDTAVAAGPELPSGALRGAFRIVNSF